MAVPELKPDQVDALERLARRDAVFMDGYRADLHLPPDVVLALIAGWRRGLAQAQATKEQPDEAGECEECHKTLTICGACGWEVGRPAGKSTWFDESEENR